MAVAREIVVHLPEEMADALSAVAGEGVEQFILDAVAAVLKRRRQIQALRDAAGLWKDYDHIPRDPAGIVTYVRAQRQHADRSS